MKTLYFSILAAMTLAVANGDTISVTGTSKVSPWGIVNSATYGQTITVPDTDTELLSFSFALGRRVGGSGPIEYEAYIYAWSADTATGFALFQSPEETYKPGATFQTVTFDPDIELTADDQYVLFLSTSGLQGATDATINWFLNFDQPYTGGMFWYADNGNDPDFTTADWKTTANPADLDFSADFASPVPEPASILLVGSLILGLAGVAHARRPTVPHSSSSGTSRARI